jgi:preprotein translocase subunit SecD
MHKGGNHTMNQQRKESLTALALGLGLILVLMLTNYAVSII